MRLLFNTLLALLGSLKLTVACLALAIVLVFVGTLAQAQLGVYRVQSEFFNSFIVFWSPADKPGVKIPVFPGGYLICSVLLLNLIAAHVVRFKPRTNMFGTLLTHTGLALLLLGQFATNLLSTESHIRLAEGEMKNYSESSTSTELAVVDVTEPDIDKVVSIPASLLARASGAHNPAKAAIKHPQLPFSIRVVRYLHNARLSEHPLPGFEKSPATHGVGARFWLGHEHITPGPFNRDVPAALIELEAQTGSIGSWLVSELIPQPQTVEFNGRTWQLNMRPLRHYRPFWLQLIKFTHEKYPGTDIPRNFSSRLRLIRPDTGEDREVSIKMNNPLRYGGETFYQAGYDDTEPHATILQVVRNPTWPTPYIAGAMVTLGLVIQFTGRLYDFLTKQNKT